MKKSIFIISDLHLGGAPPDGKSLGYEMCTKWARGLLVLFLEWASRERNENRDVHLVINGDIVDFLAEKPFEIFTRSDADACTKFQRILKNTEEVWNALASWVKSGAALTLLLGNHDLELSLPGPRRMLLEKLGPGRVEFIYDNQALVIGPLLIEHGNRYDSWNVVPHNRLRYVRSKLSRGEAIRDKDCPQVPGSELVCRVMNPIKGDYRYIDLLKPETSAALPFLAVLEPTETPRLRMVVNTIKTGLLMGKAALTRFDSDGRPVNPEYTAGQEPSPSVSSIIVGRGFPECAAGHEPNATSDQKPSVRRVTQQADEAMKLAEELSGGGRLDQTSSTAYFEPLRRLVQAKRDTEWDQKVKHLYQALCFFREQLQLTFNFTRESNTYIKPARRSIKEYEGIRVVAYGHTHLPKRVQRKWGLYLNTGTWTDLMRLPDAVLEKNKPEAQSELNDFAADIASNRLARWRRLIPTFARIELNEEGGLGGANVYLFDGSDNPPVLNDKLFQELFRGEGKVAV